MILALAVLALMQNQWPPNSLDRPKPPVVTPDPPSDAVMLFDGKSLADWQNADSAGAPAKWLVKDG